MIEPQMMPVAIAAFAALLLLVMAILTRPWWSRAAVRGEGPVGLRGANIAAYRGRLTEIDRDVEAGVIPADDAAMLKDEAGARLLGDAVDDGALPNVSNATSNAASSATSPPRRLASAWIAVCVIVLSTALTSAWYWRMGAWRPPPPGMAQAQAEGGDDAAGAQALPPQVQAMVQRLADRLAQQPDDVDGLAQLGRAYFVMKRFEDAVKAYHEVNTRNGGKDADMLAAEGEALAFNTQMRIPQEALALFAKALKINPDQTRALWYGGLGAAQAGDYATARADWTKLRSHELPEQMKPVLDRAIAQLDQREAEEGSGAPAKAGARPTPGAAAVASGGATMLKSNADAAAAPAVSIQLKVSLAPARAASEVPADAILFVYAKADGGPPMPLAVYRGAATQWPVSVTLNDAMAMTPMMKLSAFEHYVISARISRSGQAQPQSGDWIGTLHLDRSAASVGTHELLIDQTVP